MVKEPAVSRAAAAKNKLLRMWFMCGLHQVKGIRFRVDDVMARSISHTTRTEAGTLRRCRRHIKVPRSSIRQLVGPIRQLVGPIQQLVGRPRGEPARSTSGAVGAGLAHQKG